MDLNAAYQDAKYLSDDDLHKELSNPSGLIPGYILMSEMQDRDAIRQSAGASTAPQLSMKDQLLSSRQYSKGGIIAQLNPFDALSQTMKNPQLMGSYMQDAINQQSGGLPSLQAAQAPGAPAAPQQISSLQPTPAGTPQEVRRFSSGGLASLIRG